ncbi:MULTISPECIES: hypothetical protein [Citrobacter]|uniref:hypothetical protein n=1 Tax=Citrobacter TaxID=544 RepID=UPI00190038B6|nr:MULTISPECIES: hypothetical protein [Citrobacter]MBJ9134417.1 hypothetical protein [Citrobacter farmeri]MDM2738400.1 hypothetical protein [Citrobacter sp. Ct235]
MKSTKTNEYYLSKLIRDGLDPKYEPYIRDGTINLHKAHKFFYSNKCAHRYALDYINNRGVICLMDIIILANAIANIYLKEEFNNDPYAMKESRTWNRRIRITGNDVYCVLFYPNLHQIVQDEVQLQIDYTKPGFRTYKLKHPSPLGMYINTLHEIPDSYRWNLYL